jgi:MFS family permease
MNYHLSSSQKRSPFNYGYIIVAASFVISVLNVGLFISAGVFFKPILNEFGWSRAVTSGPISTCALVTGFFYILTGALTEKFGPRLITTGCVLIAGTGYVLLSRLSSIWELYFYLGVMAAIGSSAMVPMLSSVPHWFTRNRTVMVGIIMSGGGVGGLIVPVLADWLIRRYDWRTAYLVLGIAFLVITIIAAQLLRRSPATAAQEVSARSPNTGPAPSGPASLIGVFRSRQIWLTALAFFCFGVTAMAVQFHLVNHATDIHISTSLSAGLISLINGVSVAGSILLGILGDKYSNRTLMLFGYVTLVLCMIGLLFAVSFWHLLVFSLFFGAAFGAGLSNLPSLISKTFNIAVMATVMGITNMIQTAGGSLGGFLAGYIYDLQQSYRSMFILCAVLCLIGLVAMYGLKSGSPKR